MRQYGLRIGPAASNEYGEFRMDQRLAPKISVVTISLDKRVELERTIKSVAGQSYPNIEYLIIDGGSTDGSVELIKHWSAKVHYWVSEPDKGIYDAMNKGVRAASGEWVVFMNAGDRFHDDSVLQDIWGEPHADADIVYGHALLWYSQENVGRFLRAEPPSVLPWRMNCKHQSLFARRTILLNRPFTIGLLVADYEFLARMQAEERPFKFVDRVVSVCENGGVSDMNRVHSLFQRWKVATHHGLPRWGSLSYLGMGFRAVTGPWFKRILPHRLTVWILRRLRTY